MKQRFSHITLSVFLLVLYAHVDQVLAGKIFLLVAADTSEKGGIALSTGPDTDFMRGVFYAHVSIDQLVIYGHDIDRSNDRKTVVWTGPDIRRDLGDMKNKILQAIDNCPVGTDDTIVFFYSGHGAFDSEGHYLQMPDQETTLSRRLIIQRMQSKNPRLAVIITDSCNTLVERTDRLPGLESPKTAETTWIAPLFDELFMRSEGLVDINSATEGEVAIGPIGGGLLVLAMAYGGNRPTFREVNFRGAAIESNGFGRVSIPPVDYSRVFMEHFGERVQDLHSKFDPAEPPYGFLHANAQRRLSWQDFQREVSQKVDDLYRMLYPNGFRYHNKIQYTQTPRFYSPFPPRRPHRSDDLPQALSLSRGDVILSINGNRIQGEGDCINAVRTSGRAMTFMVRDSRDGTVWRMQSQLRNSHPRFGIDLADAPGGGALVTGVEAGMPCTRNTVLGKVGEQPRPGENNGQQWSAPKYYPEVGDHIVEVNGRRIGDTDDFADAVKESPDWIVFRVIDHRTERSYTMRTHLNSKTAKSRLGIGVSDCDAAGVHVDYVRSGSPGSRCQTLR